VAIFVAILLGVLALAFVLYPLYQHANIKAQPGALPSALQAPADASTQQADREEAARRALQEVELDFQLGNLGEGDYRSLRERYMRRALSALKFRYDRERELDEKIEEQVRKLREKDENAAS
jgi:hypothetical protein